ncbi:MAG: carbon-nitrogen hydrolase family protein [Proteobacteria bacterium]|nr:carbon-nitrogen hydrolase family protein [Pseudomonadota bacterium]
MTTFKLACVQTNSGREIGPNIETVRKLVRQAGEAGADFITLPENVSMLEPRGRLIREKARPADAHPALEAFQALARDADAWLLVGSLTVKLPGDKVANRSYLLDANGAIVAWYDKIHMFDVDLPGGESYRESAIYEPGGRAVVAATPWGALGMTVCYDLRFAALYRSLAKAGARFLTVPSAFTRVTGEAHWHTLLRARAIENGCYVIAAAQCGEHAEGRQTFGHSLIVDPWGEVLADGGTEVGIIIAEIDPAKVDDARRMIPSLGHDRPFTEPEAADTDAADRGGGRREAVGASKD